MEILSTLGLSALAGAIGGLAAASVLWSFGRIAKETKICAARNEIVQLLTGRKGQVISAEGKFLENQMVPLTEDEVRGAEYYMMLRELDVVLKKWSDVLSTNRVEEVKQALDWYNLEQFSVHVVEGPRLMRARLKILQDSVWFEALKCEAAEERFKKVKHIRWLKMS